MRVVIAPDKFKGTLSAREAAEAIARGIQKARPEWELDLVPVADGGEGTMDVLGEALGAEKRAVRVRDPLGRGVNSYYRQVVTGPDAPWALMEMSHASGLWRLAETERDPLRANTFGTGQLLAAAADGANKILIGIGGSATNDGGSGMAAALGYRFFDSGDHEITTLPEGLLDLSRIDPAGAILLPPVEVLCDVTNPLLGEHGATAIYGPQKGVTAESAPALEAALERWAAVAEALTNTRHRELPGAGAAGGLGFGLMTFCSAQLCPGFARIAEHLQLARRFSAADVVITGEGALDAQTAHGKAPAGVRDMALAGGKRVIAFAGKVEDATGFDRAFALADRDPEHCMDRAEQILEECAQDWARSE